MRTVLLSLLILAGVGCVDVRVGGGQDDQPDPRIVQTLQQHDQQLRAIAQQVEGLKRAETTAKPAAETGKGFREALEKQKAGGAKAKEDKQK